MDQPGLYECVVTVPGQQLKTINTVSVTRLAAIYRNLSGNKQEVMVTDYLSGKPVDGAIVTYYGGQRRSLQELGTVKTDREGLATLPANSQVLAFQASRPGDTNAMLTNIYPMGSGRRSEKNPVEVSIFTDRGLYRPGQTIFFKGLAYVKDSNDPHAVAGQPFTVTLYDANGKEIAQKKVTTNEFGSFNGEFSLPKQTLSGVFRLSTGQMSVYIHVEEYKRPTFQAYFLPIRRYRFRRFRYHTRQGGYILRRVTAQRRCHLAYYTQALPVVEVFPSERSDTSCGREYHPFRRWDIQRIFPSPKRGGYESIRFRIPDLRGIGYRNR